MLETSRKEPDIQDVLWVIEPHKSPASFSRLVDRLPESGNEICIRLVRRPTPTVQNAIQRLRGKCGGSLRVEDYTNPPEADDGASQNSSWDPLSASQRSLLAGLWHDPDLVHTAVSFTLAGLEGKVMVGFEPWAISATDLALLLALSLLSQPYGTQSGWIRVSHRTLSLRAGLSKSAVRDAVGRLEKAQLVELRRGAYGRGNSYRLHLPSFQLSPMSMVRIEPFVKAFMLRLPDPRFREDRSGKRGLLVYAALDCGLASRIVELSQVLPMSLSTIKRRLQELKGFGLVERQGRKWRALAVAPPAWAMEEVRDRIKKIEAERMEFRGSRWGPKSELA